MGNSIGPMVRLSAVEDFVEDQDERAFSLNHWITGIQELQHRWNKCVGVDHRGDYVEKICQIRPLHHYSQPKNILAYPHMLFMKETSLLKKPT